MLVVVAFVELNDAVTPGGNPDAARLTLPVNPFCGLIVIVLVVEAPGATLMLAGVADIVNDGGAVMVKVNRAVLVSVPDVPVIVAV